MAWTPQQHYRQVAAAGGEPQGRGYWENEPAPEPEQEPAGLDAATWKIGAAAAQTAAESEAAAACAEARGALVARLAAPAALEGAAEAAEGCVWQLSGLGEAPTLGAQRPMFRLSSAAFEALGTQWRLCVETDESNRSLAAFLQRVGDSGPPESVAFALQLQAARDGQVTLLAEHSANECDFQAAGQGWGKLRLHTSLEQVHEAAAKGTVGVRVRWLRLASAAPPVDAAPTPAPAEAASSPVELPEGTPEVRTERVTQTVRLAKGSVGFGMNIDNRGVVVSVIAGSPASVSIAPTTAGPVRRPNVLCIQDNGVPPMSRIVSVQGVPVEGKPQIVAELGKPEVKAVTASPGVDFGLSLEVASRSSVEVDPALKAVRSPQS